MLGQLNQKVGWVGQAENAAADLSMDFFVMYAMAFLACSIFVCWCFIIHLQLYKMCPGWGPIRKFDADGTEEMRINQLLIHEEKNGIGHHLAGEKGGDDNLAFLQGMVGQAHGEMGGLLNQAQQQLEAQQGYGALQQQLGGNPGVAAGPVNTNGLYTGFQQEYSSIGACTWGYCEAPVQWGQPEYRPGYGDVVVRHGFADSQWMRGQSKTWAKDEQHFMMKNGMTAPPMSLADTSTEQITQRMVIDRGGY